MKTVESQSKSTSNHSRNPLQSDTTDLFFGAKKNLFFNSSPVQTKLTVGAPDDAYEKEADAMANNVVQRLSAPEALSTKDSAVQAKPIGHSITPIVQSKCDTCEKEEKLQKKEEEEADENRDVRRKPIFDSNAEPPPDDAIQRKCDHCEKEEKLQKKEGSSSSPASADLESSLMASKGSGASLSMPIRQEMESSFGTDFSNVRIHTGSNAEAMNKGLHAQAFTHGNDIYFNSGKFDTNSKSGKQLLAHELTHTIQQSGSSTPQRKIQRLPGWVSDAAGWVSDTASDIAGSVVNGAEYVGGQVVDGAKWVGGQVADGARWVGQQISEVGQWLIGRIRSVIQSGTKYLNEKWETIKTFGRTSFRDIKNGFGRLIHFVTTPLASLLTALSTMNADLLGSVWSTVRIGANALWTGINSIINGVLEFGQGIWKTVSGFVNGIFATIDGLFNHMAFNLLPEFIKAEARSILNGLRSLWNQISSFWRELWQRLTGQIQSILSGVRNFVNRIIDYSVGRIISLMRSLKELYDYVVKFFANPRATIQPLLNALAAKLNAETPGKAKELGNQTARQNAPTVTSQTANNGKIQRQTSGEKEERRTATFGEVIEGIWYYIVQAWNNLDIKEMLWTTVVNTFWPPATIEAIERRFLTLWYSEWANTLNELYTPRNFFDDPLGCLHDLWSNFLILLEFPLALWRALNNVLALLMGYITIIVVLVEAILGGIAGAEAGVVPGIIAGAAAGLATMAPLGEALMASYVTAEGATVVVDITRLFTARQTCIKRQQDILQSVSSFVGMAIALILEVLMAILAELVSLVVDFIRGEPAIEPVPQPQPKPQPKPQPQPQPQPKPQPQPQPQPAPVIPFPRPRPQPQPQPQQIAAKFEEGANYDVLPLTAVNDSNNATVQTKAKVGIDLEKCEEGKEGICYRLSRTLRIAGRNYLVSVGAASTPEDLRVAACLYRKLVGDTDWHFQRINVAVGRFLVGKEMHIVEGANLPGEGIHSEDIVFRRAEQRFGKGKFKLDALFSERVPCPQCSGWIPLFPRTPGCMIYCIINDFYDWTAIRESYHDGRIF